MTQPATDAPDDPPRILHPAAGLGLPPFIKASRAGLGFGGGRASGRGGASLPGLFEFLEMGSPRLALARALGVPFAPWMVSCTTEFTSTSPSVQPDVGADTRFSQDQWIDAAIARITSENTPLNQFDTMSDFFGNWQNAFKVKLKVVGAPRYDVIPKFTRLSNAFDMTNPLWLGGWVVTYDQQLEMDFQSTFPLADAALPIELSCTFRCWGPVGEMFTKMTAEEAFVRLARDFGIECVEAYQNFHCR
jgi:hypothetical protein